MKEKFILFCKPTCPFCVSAIDLLEARELDYSVINFEPGEERLLQEVKDAYNWRTVPIVLSVTEGGMNLIGGHDNLVEFLGRND